ncbi:apoptosis regulator BAX-like [Boleophthalmus pectinirostris]|uniref:apoptosis regulator BAX-like n=1 Tax=Boleophthalmus pectinirostris TaxID=150288 RepID=UPI00242B580B|nr:apoptosis regulator BAX-like [Boleophthalmus pectinirostris]
MKVKDFGSKSPSNRSYVSEGDRGGRFLLSEKFNSIKSPNLMKQVIKEELREEVPAEDAPPLTPLLTNQVQSQQEQTVVRELAKIIRIIGDNVKDNRLLEDSIDGLRRAPGSKLDLFIQVSDKVFTQGITWERIAVLFYVAGRLAVKLVEAHLPQSVREVVQWTVDFFRTNLLGWIRDHGGWISSFSELAAASMHTVSGFQIYGVLLVFVAGLALGSLVTLRLMHHQ